MKKFKPLGYYNYTVILTYLGMLSSLYAIALSFDRKFYEALFFLLFAAMCDTLDGAVASTMVRTEREKCFGIQIDSLCDLISFGVMPAMYVYILSEKNLVVGLICAVFVLAGLIRLAYYNVLEEERQRSAQKGTKYYTGLPITTIAPLLPITSLIETTLPIKHATICAGALIVCSIGFVSPFRIKNPNLICKMLFVLIGVAEVYLIFTMGRAIS